MFHYSVEGSILLRDSMEARDQEEFHDKKKAHDMMLLNKINKAIRESSGKVPRKYCLQICVYVTDMTNLIVLNYLPG